MNMITKDDVLSKINNDLVFQIHNMLDLKSDEKYKISNITATSTAYIINIVKQNTDRIEYFIKTSRKNAESDLEKRLGRREVDFYNFINKQNLKVYPNIPKCFKCFSTKDKYDYYIVLEDLSKKYLNAEKINFCNKEHWKYAVNALANFHMLFWNNIPDSYLKLNQGSLNEIERDNIKLYNSFIKFAEYCSIRLNNDAYKIIKHSIPIEKKIAIEQYRRYQNKENLTIVHGDAHNNNFLYPKSKKKCAYIIDWQFWDFGIGTYDLRHLLGLGLNNRMRKYQKELVEYYYEIITRRKDLNYSWDECWRDYKLGIIDNLFMPIWQYVGFHWEYDRWKETLKNVIDNYIELECDRISI